MWMWKGDDSSLQYLHMYLKTINTFYYVPSLCERNSVLSGEPLCRQLGQEHSLSWNTQSALHSAALEG